jgi:hypothetical protein
MTLRDKLTLICHWEQLNRSKQPSHSGDQY